MTANLPDEETPPELIRLFEAFAVMSPSELAGAFHAYETQLPAVAETKGGLRTHDGIPAADMTFFDGEDEHIAFGTTIREEDANTDALDRGFREGPDHIYNISYNSGVLT